uniref:Uncharacterized protein n=1 Tax=Siphoviridae sp. ctdcr45 TaxID=2825580 RepID=A0A8S5Q7T1_9CAUD|nr:MAG TPA: hypothetical protein [Siphoviridae sp. ctdcr45]
MAYQGYLIKVGNTVFPMKYIRAETYKCTPNQRIDQDSDSDATGMLHRNVLPHTRTKIEFETPQMLRGADVLAISTLLGLSGSRRDVTITYWDHESQSYKTGKCYVPDISYQLMRNTGSDLVYMPIRYAFIEY